MIATYHYDNANGNILLSKGANLMQPPIRPPWGTWGVAFLHSWTATQDIFNPTVMMFRLRPGSTLVV